MQIAGKSAVAPIEIIKSNRPLRSTHEINVDAPATMKITYDREVDARLEIRELQGRCLFNDPYLQHLITRFRYYQYRVALPEPHTCEPYIQPALTGQIA